MQEEVDEVIAHPEEISGEAVVEQMQQDVAEAPEEPAEKMVPLSAVLKERKKRQELELNVTWQQQQIQQMQQAQRAPEPVDDTSRYESATREDLGKTQQETVRIIEEKMWIKQNPEKYERLNEQLPQFLKQRPNLASAINESSNRYEEAYTLMEALTPKQQQQLKASSTPKKEAPNSPASVPKSAAINAAVDVMSMSDAEFAAWRASKKKRR